MNKNLKLDHIIKSKNLKKFDYKPYIIAEAGVNHGCKIELAKRLIDDAAEGGAHAIKFQTYKADTIASKNSPAYWDTSKEKTKSQHQLFSKYDKFWKSEFEILKKHCDKNKIDFMSTPFDIESAKFLSDMMDVFKISSSDITNKPFIKYITSFNKPILLSTGASNINEIKSSVKWIEEENIDVALMHCILNYPTLNKNANLAMISDLESNFPKNIIGYSDHTLPGDLEILKMSVVLGCKIIEKHFTYDKKLEGNDHYHAMDLHDLKIFIKEIDSIFNVLGSNKKHALDTEMPAVKNARRSLVALCKIEAGEIISKNHLTFKRPASGISPSKIDSIIGKKSKRKIEKDEIIFWEMIE
tara:strand:- start:16627 stop:17694 length:1068 start_codon:yes stop_codon:yes gene_type:complete